MKNRLYQKQVLEGRALMNKALSVSRREFRTDIILTIIAFIFSVAIAIFLAVYVSRFTVLFSAPFLAKIFATRFFYLYTEWDLIKLMSTNTGSYSKWMKLQLKKEYHNKENDLSNAMSIYKQYIDNIPENRVEIISKLNNELSKKTEQQIVVSVLCGLLFICENPRDRDIIFKATYKHGSAGNMVLTEWILFLDGNSDNEISFEELKKDFTSFWDKTSNGKNKHKNKQ